jgi:uncharacterized protein YlxW (UPF0749 family)
VALAEACGENSPVRRSGLLFAAACVLLGFLAAVALRARPPSPEARLPGRYRLAALIERQQTTTAGLRREVDELRARVDRLVEETGSQEAGAPARSAGLDKATLSAGLVALRGPGVRVTLDDSLLDEAPTGNVNDLVIHSQDVQAAVNALWHSGAEALAINGQRLVGTSAVLCVGNTLLLNGTVHSPPYVISAVGAQKDRFDADPLVRRLHEDADAFGIRFSVARTDSLDVPAYRGSTALRYAKPAA